ncbi:MAG: hypothetical protein JWQ86_6456 [Mycobacterium sp.]|jgi:hypothetical protein|nr:hypothetical protein [Mycobacterium sp.]MDT5214148.1 hypothetical protein [Mycobacterium sp.]
MRRRDEVPTANIVPTLEALSQMLDQKPTCWRFAAFASILFQRWAAVEERRVRLVLRYRADPSRRLRFNREVALFVAEQLELATTSSKRWTPSCAAPTFMEVFGDPADESTAGANGIVRIAHRLADYYDRFLELAEECRDCSVPGQYSAPPPMIT